MGDDEKCIQLAEAEPSFIWKRRMLIIAFWLRLFLAGIEYSVILPSALLYMKTFQVAPIMNGFVVAAYPFAGMITTPFIGRFYDLSRKILPVFLMLNTCEIIGNIIYSLPFSPWLPIIGRLIAGCGDGFLSCAAGEVMYIYPKSSRTGIMSILELGEVLGLTLGPVINFFTDSKKVYILTWRLDYTTLPGIIMAFFWIMMQFLTLGIVSNLSMQMSAMFHSDKNNREADKLDFIDSDDAPSIEDKNAAEETFFLMKNEDNARADVCLTSDNKEEEETFSISSELKEFFYTPDYLVVVYIEIVLWTSQTVFEYFLPYITEIDFGWKPAWTGLIYMIGGMIMITIFLTLYRIGLRYYIRDTYLLLSSLLITQIALALLIYEGVLAKHRNVKTPDSTNRVVVFSFLTVLVFVTVPFNLVASKSLLLKIVRPQSQGFIQGMFQSVTKVALIMGPILGSLVSHTRDIYGVAASLVLLPAIFLFIPFIKRLHKKEDAMAETVLDELTK